MYTVVAAAAAVTALGGGRCGTIRLEMKRALSGLVSYALLFMKFLCVLQIDEGYLAHAPTGTGVLPG